MKAAFANTHTAVSLKLTKDFHLQAPGTHMFSIIFERRGQTHPKNLEKYKITSPNPGGGCFLTLILLVIFSSIFTWSPKKGAVSSLFTSLYVNLRKDHRCEKKSGGRG